MKWENLKGCDRMGQKDDVLTDDKQNGIGKFFDRLCLRCGTVKKRAAQESEEKEMRKTINGERTERTVLPELLKEYIGC